MFTIQSYSNFDKNVKYDLCDFFMIRMELGNIFQEEGYLFDSGNNLIVFTPR